VALRSRVRSALKVAALLAAAAALHGVSPTTSDPDGFYHIRHAWLYRTQGLFDSAFPWARFSAIRDQASDLWYGFHVLLVPFSLPQNLLHGLLAGGVAVTAASLLLLAWAFSLLRLSWPLVWLVAFAATGDVLFRLTMLRPQPLSLALAVLALALLAAPSVRGRAAWLGVVALLAAWIHLALAWLQPLVLLVFAASALAHRQRPDWAGARAVAAGTLAGWLLRPNPLGALRLAWVQLGLFVEVKGRGLPLPFGQELQPLSPTLDLPRLVLPGLAVVGALVAFGIRVRRQPAPAPPLRVAAWTSLSLGLFFALLSVRVAGRSIELAAVFLAAFAGLVFTECRQGASRRVRIGTAAVPALVLAVLVPQAAARYEARVQTARPLLAFRGASAWLAHNSRSGELVFHAWWDQFPHLFFWSPRNHYLGGMDPLFQYAHDEALFWKAYGLATDAHPQGTCGKPACGAGELEETALVLRRDFGASFVLVHRHQNPRLDAYLQAQGAFQRVFDDGTDAVYRVQYDSGLLPGGAP
jgi:hypothetical protein